jgi:uncharacterized membrane protein YeaQ/YmgE (transglycosylase-associated protein family)
MQLFAVLAFIALLLVIWFSLTAVSLLFHFIPWIIIGLIAGAIASAITGSRHGILGDIGLGLLGSVIAGFLLRVVFHYQATNFIEDIIVATAGAIVVLLIGKAVSPRRAF